MIMLIWRQVKIVTLSWWVHKNVTGTFIKRQKTFFKRKHSFVHDDKTVSYQPITTQVKVFA